MLEVHSPTLPYSTRNNFTRNPEQNARLVERPNVNLEFSPNDEDATGEDQWKHIKSAFMNTCDSILGLVPRDQKSWMSDTTCNKIKEHRTAKSQTNAAKTRAMKKAATVRTGIKSSKSR